MTGATTGISKAIYDAYLLFVIIAIVGHEIWKRVRFIDTEFSSGVSVVKIIGTHDHGV